LYREFLAQRARNLGDLAIVRTDRKDDLEPYWQEEKDRLCAVEFLPSDDRKGRLFAADIVGYKTRLAT